MRIVTFALEADTQELNVGYDYLVRSKSFTDRPFSELPAETPFALEVKGSLFLSAHIDEQLLLKISTFSGLDFKGRPVAISKFAIAPEGIEIAKEVGELLTGLAPESRSVDEATIVEPLFLSPSAETTAASIERSRRILVCGSSENALLPVFLGLAARLHRGVILSLISVHEPIAQGFAPDYERHSFDYLANWLQSLRHGGDDAFRETERVSGIPREDADDRTAGMKTGTGASKPLDEEGLKPGREEDEIEHFHEQVVDTISLREQEGEISLQGQERLDCAAATEMTETAACLEEPEATEEMKPSICVIETGMQDASSEGSSIGTLKVTDAEDLAIGLSSDRVDIAEEGGNNSLPLSWALDAEREHSAAPTLRSGDFDAYRRDVEHELGRMERRRSWRKRLQALGYSNPSASDWHQIVLWANAHLYGVWKEEMEAHRPRSVVFAAWIRFHLKMVKEFSESAELVDVPTILYTPADVVALISFGEEAIALLPQDFRRYFTETFAQFCGYSFSRFARRRMVQISHERRSES